MTRFVTITILLSFTTIITANEYIFNDTAPIQYDLSEYLQQLYPLTQHVGMTQRIETIEKSSSCCGTQQQLVPPSAFSDSETIIQLRSSSRSQNQYQNYQSRRGLLQRLFQRGDRSRIVVRSNRSS